MTAFVAFEKILSPQYLTWLVPLVPLAAGRRGRWAAVVFLGVLALTKPEYLVHRDGLRNQDWTVWVLLVRNLGLGGDLRAAPPGAARLSPHRRNPGAGARRAGTRAPRRGRALSAIRSSAGDQVAAQRLSTIASVTFFAFAYSRSSCAWFATGG